MLAALRRLVRRIVDDRNRAGSNYEWWTAVGDEIRLSAFDATPVTTLRGRDVAGRRLTGATDVCGERERLADRYGPGDFE
jgi:hypothetical protein